MIYKMVLVASNAHSQQKRKWVNEAYINHPLRVMNRTMLLGFGDSLNCVSLGHDLYEDTTTTYDDISREFGENIASDIQWLTSPDIKGSRAVRKQAQRDHCAAAPGVIQTIKLLDRIDNFSTIHMSPGDFPFVYAAESDLLNKALTRADPAVKLELDQAIKPFLKK